MLNLRSWDQTTNRIFWPFVFVFFMLWVLRTSNYQNSLKHPFNQKLFAILVFPKLFKYFSRKYEMKIWAVHSFLQYLFIFGYFLSRISNQYPWRLDKKVSSSRFYFREDSGESSFRNREYNSNIDVKTLQIDTFFCLRCRH